jgi:hypothetical protein
MHAALRFGFLLTIAATTTSGSAAQSSRPAVEQQVRVTLAPDPLKDDVRQPPGLERTFKGRILRHTNDSIVVLQHGFGERHLRLADVRSVEASQGSRRNFGKGLAIGALAGAALGVVVGLASASSADDVKPPCNPATDLFCGIVGATVDAATDPGLLAVTGAIGFGVIGAASGGVIGLLTKTEKWRSVDLAPGGPTASLIVRPGSRTRIGASLRF